MMLYICTKLMKVSPWVLGLMSRHNFQVKFSKGNNSVKNEDGVTVLVLCTLSDDALFFTRFL